MLKYLKGWYRTLRDSFVFVVTGNEAAYERLVEGVKATDERVAKVIKTGNAYQVVVNKKVVDTYSRKADAVRGAKRQGFAVIETA